MKSLLGVLSLLIVLVYSQADEPIACNKTLGPEELAQLAGDWVLTFLAYDKTMHFDEEMQGLTSSHMEVLVLPGNHTLAMHERNMIGGKCVSYTFNLTLPQSHDEDNHLNLEEAMKTKENVVTPFFDNATVTFIANSETTMVFHYESKKYGGLMQYYWKEGQHLDKDKEEEHKKHRVLTKCLNLPEDHIEEWHYKGADFCHKKSVLPTLGPDELHLVNGSWDLLWMTFDFTKEALDMVISNSYIELHVLDDHYTVDFNEQNVIKGKCVSYTGNLTLPLDSENIFRFKMEGAMEHMDAVMTPFNDTATAEFLKMPENFMQMLYKSKNHGVYLLTYIKHLQDRKDLEKQHKEHKAIAEYLGIHGKHYKELQFEEASPTVSEVCSKKAAS